LPKKLEYIGLEGAEKERKKEKPSHKIFFSTMMEAVSLEDKEKPTTSSNPTSNVSPKTFEYVNLDLGCCQNSEP
jgi:hypothetical protein